jgi:hypothetical protein
MRLPFLILHIAAGSLGILSGFAAMSLGKGSRWHALAGQIFVISMLIMSSFGVALAIMKWQPGNILGGTLTFYLVATAWTTARRGDRKVSLLDWGGLLLVLAIAAIEVSCGLQAAISPTGLKYDYPPGPFFFLGSIAMLAAAGDIRMLSHGGISGAQRIARHLWRMCFGLFIAAGSVFLARQHLFPELIRRTGVLYLLSFLPLIVMIFWLIRICITHAFKPKGMAGMPA